MASHLESGKILCVCVCVCVCVSVVTMMTLHQPCKNQTALQLHHLGVYSKHSVKSNSRSFRVACDKNAVSLLESREQRYIKAIKNFVLM